MNTNVAATLVAVLALAACKPVNEPQFDPRDAASNAAAAATRQKEMTVEPAAGIKGCPDYPYEADSGRTRKAPLPVPAGMASVMASDRDHFAVASLGGGTICVDTRSMDRISNLAQSPDKRFVSWSWDGYEAFGHVVVDRTGNGEAIDTGTTPVASPSGRRIAAVDWSESAFGGLNAFGVWNRAGTGLETVARIETPPRDFTEWKVEGWQGEDCVRLSATSFAQSAEGKGSSARTAFLAHPDAAGTWTVGPAATETCPAK